MVRTNPHRLFNIEKIMISLCFAFLTHMVVGKQATPWEEGGMVTTGEEGLGQELTISHDKNSRA